MTLAAALLPLLPGGAGVIALVGAGGKTSALFHLGAGLVAEGRRVLLTSTTHLLDPQQEAARPPLTLVLCPDLEAPSGACALAQASPGLTVLMARPAAESGKLKGIHPAWIPALRATWDIVLVEADGSRRLPLKAPADHEPVLPPGTDLVVGVVGLSGLGRPLDDRTVTGPSAFATSPAAPWANPSRGTMWWPWLAIPRASSRTPRDPAPCCSTKPTRPIPCPPRTRSRSCLRSGCC